MRAIVIALALSAADDPYRFTTDSSRLRAEAIETLVADLADPKKGRDAAARLVSFGRAAVPALTKALADGNVQVRFYAASALDLISDPRATDALFRALSDGKESPLVRKVAARAMGRAGHAPAAAVLLDLAGPAYLPPSTSSEKARPDVRKADAAATGGPPAPDLLSSDEDFRFEAVRALGCILSGDSDGVLAAALSDPSARIREAAATGLGDRCAAGALDALRKALKDPDGTVASAAARSVGKLGRAAASAVDDLVEALAREDVRVRRAAQGALVVVTGMPFRTPEKWREWHEARSRPPGGTGSAAGTGEAPAETPPSRPPTGSFSDGKTPGPSSGGTPPALRPPWAWDEANGP